MTKHSIVRLPDLRGCHLELFGNLIVPRTAKSLRSLRAYVRQLILRFPSAVCFCCLVIELAYVANIKTVFILFYFVGFAVKNIGKFLEITSCLHVLKEMEKFSVLPSSS